jgi:hypothetical protein
VPLVPAEPELPLVPAEPELPLVPEVPAAFNQVLPSYLYMLVSLVL